MSNAVVVTKDANRKLQAVVVEASCADELILKMAALGFKSAGVTRSYENADPRSAVPRKELWGQPRFERLCGPMWGGEDTPLRYESWEAYETLSR